MVVKRYWAFFGVTRWGEQNDQASRKFLKETRRHIGRLSDVIIRADT